MTLTRLGTMLAVAAAFGAASWVTLTVVTGRWFEAVTVPWTVPAVLALISGGILAAAWPVRSAIRRKTGPVDPWRATAVLALAKSCALAGAALAGVYLGIALVAVQALHSPAAWTRLWQDLTAMAAACALALCGRAAESFCRLPPPGADGADGASGAGGSGGAARSPG